MRISNQQIVSQVLGDVRKLEDKSSGKLLEGQLFKAAIQAVSSSHVRLQLEGGLFLDAKTLTGHPFQSGDVVEFEVVQEGAPPVIRLVGTESGRTEHLELRQMLEALFSGSGSKVTEAMEEGAKSLSRFGIPITQASVREIVGFAKQAEMLKGLIESEMLGVDDIPSKSPIKQMLVSYFSSQRDEMQLHHAMKGERLQPSGVSSSGRDALGADPIRNSTQELALEQGREAGAPSLGTYPSAASKTEEDGQRPVGLSGQLSSEGRSASAEPLVRLVELLSGINYDKLAFHMRTNAENSLQNLEFLDNLLFGKNTIGNQLEQLAETISAFREHMPGQAVLSLEALRGEGVESTEAFEKNVRDLLAALEEDASDQGSRKMAQVKGQVETLDKSLNYLRNIHAELSYFQLPLKVDDELRSVNLFVKQKKKGGEGSDDGLTIFISLDTRRLKTVQATIEDKRDELSIQFRLEDKEVMELMELSARELENNLSEISGKTLKLVFRVADSQASVLDGIASLISVNTGSIDVRV